MTVKSSARSAAVKPAAHSIATQTSQPPSAAAAFFIRSVNATHRKALTSVSRRQNNVSDPRVRLTLISFTDSVLQIFKVTFRPGPGLNRAELYSNLPRKIKNNSLLPAVWL